MNPENNIDFLIKAYSSSLDYSIPRTSIILAAGHGKRIKSSQSKSLFKIWDKPSVLRVSEAAKTGISSSNQIIVVGIKAEEVIKRVGKSKNTCFVYQKQQNGTGDAVKVALDKIDKKFKGDIHIFPADAGLITEDTIKNFKIKFKESGFDMMVLTGKYEGTIDRNHYGRIIKDKKRNEVVEIKEYKDILALKSTYKTKHKGSALSFTKEELLKNKEFNSGIYAFKIEPLRKYLSKLKTNNIQKEYYITDMIKIFNNNNLKVGSQIVDSDYVIGFNDRVMLNKMEKIAQKRVYEQLKEIVTFQDPEDFFIAEEVAQNILKMSKKGILVDLTIGKGAYWGQGVILNKGVKIGKNSRLKGNITLGENVDIGSDVQISADNKNPVKIGNNVSIKGPSYIFGCIIDSDVSVEHCILKNKHIKKKISKDGKVKAIRYIFPKAEGTDCVEDL